MTKIKSILIANRGEPVRRAIRTCRELGIRVATIATENDLTSDSVIESDLCLKVSSYLAGDEIIAQAKETGIDAIWPGWGFLSENEEFARHVTEAGLIWIGPPPSVIASLASKDEATKMAKKAGLKTIPETVFLVKDNTVNFEEVSQAAFETGYPVLLKPALGGGGQGQVVVRDPQDLLSSWNEVLQINKNQFKSGPILVQKFFDETRHIEVQVVADQYGQVIILGERECSVQRRNQKVIEEAPSPALTPERRQSLLKRSADFAKTVGYQNAGTIEYLFSQGEFYFLEMNTRLQVEHSVSEEAMRIAGRKIDLVAEMIRLAAGEKLGYNQSQVEYYAHAIEARVYAEDPEKNYRPSPGDVYFYHFPQNDFLRIESAFTSYPFEVSPLYDPMIAKVIAFGKDRQTAIQNLESTLGKTIVFGLPSNLKLCQNILTHKDFCEGNYSTKFLTKNNHLVQNPKEDPAQTLAIAAIIQYIYDMASLRRCVLSKDLPTSFDRIRNLIPKNNWKYEADYLGKTTEIEVFEQSKNQFLVNFCEQTLCFEVHPRDPHHFIFFFSDGKVIDVRSNIIAQEIKIYFSGQTRTLNLKREGADNLARDPHAAPLVGQVVALAVKAGQNVVKDQELYQIESMKMITTVRAKENGSVKTIQKNIGDAVKAGDIIVEIPIQVTSESDGHQWTATDFETHESQNTLSIMNVLWSYFLGYDVSETQWDMAFNELQNQIEFGLYEKEKFSQALAQIIKQVLLIVNLFQESENALTFLAEQDDVAENFLPQKQVKLIKEVLNYYGLAKIAEIKKNPRVLIHLFQSYKNEKGKKTENLSRLLRLGFQFSCLHKDLPQPLKNWLALQPKLDEETRKDIWSYFYLLDPQAYYEFADLPVALEYLDEYQENKKNPRQGLSQKEYEKLMQEICTDPTTHMTSQQCQLENSYQELSFDEFPDHLKNHLKKWFAAFRGRRINLPQKIADKDIILYEMIGDDPKLSHEIPPRFVAFGLFEKAELEVTTSGEAKIPEIEKAAIDSYKVLKLVQIGEIHKPNKVFLLSKDQTPIPWKSRDLEENEKSLTPQNASQIAARVGGFARGLLIESTEVVMPVRNFEDQKTYWTLTEYRHSQAKGVISRPPNLIEEVQPFPLQDQIAQMNERQQRMGKLLNPDRATLLFDQGKYKEIFFPEVDDGEEIGLSVYEGQVGGIETLAYAGDFRFRGGALGEREGKKLASTVVLAYLLSRPLIAFHDGAGANIKESISSLGWAGAYFGAIAHTGGFSDKNKFAHWYKNHICRPYFDKVLNTFGLNLSIDEILKNVQRQLLHFHLHVGATVGMLVYGASIAHASLMNNQPESYRVLTGSVTVKKVLGENATNYSLGGAKAHGERSGDIEMVFDTEEQVIDETRRLIDLFTTPKRFEQIQRNAAKPILETPVRAGIILGRDAIVSHVDKGEFFEIRPNLKGTKALLTGYASLAGQPIALVATATDYGISNANTFKKATLLIEAAQDLELPVVLASGAQWEAPPIPISTQWLTSREGFFSALRRCRVPVLSLALGPRSLEQAIHQHSDFHLYVKRGDETPSENERVLQISPIAALTLEDAFNHIAKLLKYLPLNPNGKSHLLKNEDAIHRDSDFTLPSILTEAYEMRNVIQAIFDKNSFIEFWSDDKLPLIVGVATLGQIVVGVIADNPSIESGAQNVNSIEKFTRLNRICERFHLPIVEINDSPAFRPGHEQEHAGIQGVGGRSIREECLSSIPKVAVTLRQNYGGRLIHANLITLGPDRKGLILEGAQVGVMGAKGAVSVLYGKKLVALPEEERAEAEAKWQKEYEQNQLDPKKAVELGYVEGPIKPQHIRRELHRQLCELLLLRQSCF